MMLMVGKENKLRMMLRWYRNRVYRLESFEVPNVVIDERKRSLYYIGNFIFALPRGGRKIINVTVPVLTAIPFALVDVNLIGQFENSKVLYKAIEAYQGTPLISDSVERIGLLPDGCNHDLQYNTVAWLVPVTISARIVCSNPRGTKGTLFIKDRCDNNYLPWFRYRVVPSKYMEPGETLKCEARWVDRQNLHVSEKQLSVSISCRT